MCFWIVFAFGKPTSSRVSMSLTEADFEDVLLKHNNVFIKFYTNWYYLEVLLEIHIINSNFAKGATSVTRFPRRGRQSQKTMLKNKMF